MIQITGSRVTHIARSYFVVTGGTTTPWVTKVPVSSSKGSGNGGVLKNQVGGRGCRDQNPDGSKSGSDWDEAVVTGIQWKDLPGGWEEGQGFEGSSEITFVQGKETKSLEPFGEEVTKFVTFPFVFSFVSLKVFSLWITRILGWDSHLKFLFTSFWIYGDGGFTDRL